MLVYENRASKMKFFRVKELFFIDFDFKMGVEMNLRIITKKHAADLERGFLKKSILKPNDRAETMPTAWELILSSRVRIRRL